MSAELTRRDRLLLWLAERLGGCYLRLLERRVDREVYGEEHLARAVAQGKGVILCFWHGRMLPLAVRFRNQGIVVLISPHRDGEIIARLVENRGFQTSRGSTFREPLKVSLRIMKRLRRKKEMVAITPDGPRGPREKVHGGIIRLASQTGAPIVTMASAAAPAKYLSSWDHFMVPFPWSRTHVRLGKPRAIPPGLTPETEEEQRAQLENDLLELQREADRSLPRSGAFGKQLAALGLRCCAALWRVLPERVSIGSGRWLGRVVHALSARLRERVTANLHRALGAELTMADECRLVRENFMHYGTSLVEFALLPKWQQEGRLDRIAWRGWDHLARAAAQGKGIIFLAAHVGNHELLGAAMAARGLRFAAIARTADDPGIDRYINEVRQSVGMEVISKQDVGMNVVRRLGRGDSIAMLIDVNAGFKGIFVPFFDEQASTYTTVAELAGRTGTPVVPIFSHRLPDGNHVVEVAAALPYLSARNREDELRINTAQYNLVYEKYIRRYPQQWFWAHHRWKTRPGDRENNIYRSS